MTRGEKPKVIRVLGAGEFTGDGCGPASRQQAPGLRLPPPKIRHARTFTCLGNISGYDAQFPLPHREQEREVAAENCYGAMTIGVAVLKFLTWVTVTLPGPAQAPAVFGVNVFAHGFSAPVLSVQWNLHPT